MESLLPIRASRWKVDSASFGPPVPSCKLKPGKLRSGGPLVPGCKLAVHTDRLKLVPMIDRSKGHNFGLQHSLSSPPDLSKWWPPRNKSRRKETSGGCVSVKVVAKRRLILWRHRKDLTPHSRHWNEATKEIIPKINDLVRMDKLWIPQRSFVSTSSTSLWNNMQPMLWKGTVKEELVGPGVSPNLRLLLTNNFQDQYGYDELVTTMVMTSADKWDFEETVYELNYKQFGRQKGRDFFAVLESTVGKSWFHIRSLNPGDWSIIHPTSL